MAAAARPLVAGAHPAAQAARVASPRAQPALRAADRAVQVDPAAQHRRAQQRRALQAVRVVHPAELVDLEAGADRGDPGALEDRDKRRTPAP